MYVQIHTNMRVNMIIIYDYLFFIFDANRWWNAMAIPHAYISFVPSNLYRMCFCFDTMLAFNKCRWVIVNSLGHFYIGSTTAIETMYWAHTVPKHAIENVSNDGRNTKINIKTPRSVYVDEWIFIRIFVRGVSVHVWKEVNHMIFDSEKEDTYKRK